MVLDPAMFDTASGRLLKSACDSCDPGAELTITPLWLYFGYITPASMSEWQPLIIENTGIVAVGIESLTISGPFEITGTQPILLVPGENVTYSVRFVPTVEGLAGGDIVIKAATAGEQPTVKLVGIGGELIAPAVSEEVPWAYRYGSFAVADIQINEVLLDYHVTTTHRLQSNLSGCKFSVGTPPAADYELLLLVDGVQKGTIIISATGAVTMSTNGNSSVLIPINSIVTVQAPAVADATLARLRMTLVGVI